MKEKDCSELRSLAFLNYEVKLSKDQSPVDQLAKILFLVRDIPQVLFFALADCDRKAFVSDENELDFKLELSLLNDGSHFSEERHGMILYYSSALIVFALVLGTSVYHYVKDLLKYNKPETPMLILMMSATL